MGWTPLDGICAAVTVSNCQHGAAYHDGFGHRETVWSGWAEHVLFRERLTRVKLLSFLPAQTRCVVAMEAWLGRDR
jgi:hypothetical protein